MPTPNIQHLADQGVLFRHAFCAALKETGQPRRPREYFWGLRSPEVIRLLPHDANIELLAARSETWSREDYRRHLDWALREGTTLNGVFGAKMMWGYFKVRQAVSLWRALQTWVWRKEAGAPADEPLPSQRSVYSFDAIDHLLDQLRRHEDSWRGFFFRIGQRPLSILYEDVAGDLEGSVGRVLTEIGVEPPADRALPGRSPSRQSDELSESWVQTYLEDVSPRR